jgi:nitric oxide reductase activation protein
MLSLLRRERRRTSKDSDATVYYYDEWDYTIQDYRPGWCRLLEREVKPAGEDFAAQVRATYGPLIPSVRRQFEKIRPEEYRKEKSLLDGEEIDLDRAVEHLIDRMSGLPGTNRLYQQRRKVERDVCTVFLVDMSSSTSEPVCQPVEDEGGEGKKGQAAADGGAGEPAATGGNVGREPDRVDELSRVLSGLRTNLASSVKAVEWPDSQKRIIDIEKEALILLAEALGALGDRYGIFGFSGCGRNQVDFYTIKECSQRYTDQVKARIGAIEPKGSTRMGTALRHCRAKLGKEDARRKNLFLISDGFPQDQDYGHDRTSHEYGVQDTAQALAELEKEGTFTYCITVDRRGEDYLRKMCPEARYMVIHDILSLPEVLLKLYRKVTV